MAREQGSPGFLLFFRSSHHISASSSVGLIAGGAGTQRKGYGAGLKEAENVLRVSAKKVGQVI